MKQKAIIMATIPTKRAPDQARSFGVLYRRFKPHLLMLLVQMGYSILHFLAEASFNHGMNPYIYVTYRHLVGALVIFPFAYVLERKMRPKITLAIFLEVLVLSIFGISLNVNLYFLSMRYTSPAFVSSVINTISPITFVLAVVLRMEIVHIRSPRGIAKVLGTLLSLAGVMIVTLYQGPALKSFWTAPMHMRKNAIRQDWIKGSILAMGSCISWAIWFLMQANTLKKYPAPLTLTAWMNFAGAAQTAIFTALIQHKPGRWAITSVLDFASIIYAGVCCCGLIIYILLWCNEKKGPVFVTMFNPLTTILVAVIAYVAVGEKLYVGSILGGAIVMIGLYLLLWGKEGDQTDQMKSQDALCPLDHGQEEPNIQNATSAGRDTL